MKKRDKINLLFVNIVNEVNETYNRHKKLFALIGFAGMLFSFYNILRIENFNVKVVNDVVYCDNLVVNVNLGAIVLCVIMTIFTLKTLKSLDK